jgi:hypothetical protein
MAMPSVAAANDFARGNVQGRKERGGAMPEVIVCGPFRLTRLEWKQRLAAFQCLNLTFFIHTEHQRPLRRTHIKTDDITHLFHKEGIGGKFELILTVSAAERSETTRASEPEGGMRRHSSIRDHQS